MDHNRWQRPSTDESWNKEHLHSNTFYQQLKRYKINLTDFDVVNEHTSELFSIISQRKDEYYCDLAKTIKWYSNKWKDLLVYAKNIFNGRKIPVILPLLIDDKLVMSDFKQKPNRWIFLSSVYTSWQ